MNQTIEFRINHAKEDQIATHLRLCDTVFVPPLSTRVSIDSYAHKIVHHAQRFEAWADEKLVGLVAIYCNAADHSKAFITNVSLLPTWQGQGIATRLMVTCVDHAQQGGFRRIALEVGHDNVAALKLYKKIGFKIDQENQQPISMHLKIAASHLQRTGD